jgi:hypothetical protein
MHLQPAPARFSSSLILALTEAPKSLTFSYVHKYHAYCAPKCGRVEQTFYMGCAFYPFILPLLSRYSIIASFESFQKSALAKHHLFFVLPAYSCLSPDIKDRGTSPLEQTEIRSLLILKHLHSFQLPTLNPQKLNRDPALHDSTGHS